MSDEELDYSEEELALTVTPTPLCSSSEAEEPAPKRRRAACPEGCILTREGDAEVMYHWRAVHEQQVLLFCCSYPDCGRKFPVSDAAMLDHIVAAHHLTPRQLSGIRSLPRVVELKKNTRFCEPRSARPYLASVLPARAVGFNDKYKLLRQIRQALGEEQDGKSADSNVAPPPPSQPLPPREEPAARESRADEPEEGVVTVSSLSELPLLAPGSGATTRMLRRHIEDLDGLSGRVALERAATVRRLECSQDRRIRELERELSLARQQQAVLERRLQKYEDGRRHGPAPPRVAGDLERIPSTAAFILFPAAGVSAVYRLQAEDVELLDLHQRTPCLSSDRL